MKKEVKIPELCISVTYEDENGEPYATALQADFNELKNRVKEFEKLSRKEIEKRRNQVQRYLPLLIKLIEADAEVPAEIFGCTMEFVLQYLCLSIEANNILEEFQEDGAGVSWTIHSDGYGLWDLMIQEVESFKDDYGWNDD